MMLSPKLSTTLSYESLHCVHWTRDLFKKHWYIQYFCCGRCICIQGNDPKGLQTTSAKWKLSVYICVTSKTNRPISELGTFKKTDHNRVVVLYMSVVTMVSLDSRNGNDIVPGSQKSNTFLAACGHGQRVIYIASITLMDFATFFSFCFFSFIY